ncbi:MAG: response regulator [Leptospiraceae bacterium]|nr:response regulator [Leptospiraceae bacterium]MCP5499033.1 response regulator [Leptospiraceae bacterium]
MELILAIDGEHRSLIELESMLRGLRFRIVATDDYEKGIYYSRSGSPDIILLGLSMERRESIECIVNLKKEAISSDIPILGMFSNKNEMFINKIKRFGLNDFFLKPPEKKTLLKLIAENLKLSKEKEAKSILERRTHILVEQPTNDRTSIAFKSGLLKYVFPEIRTVFNAEFLNSIMQDKICLDLRDIPNLETRELSILELLVSTFGEKKISVVAGKHIGLILTQTNLDERVNLFMTTDEYETFLKSNI